MQIAIAARYDAIIYSVDLIYQYLFQTQSIVFYCMFACSVVVGLLVDDWFKPQLRKVDHEIRHASGPAIESE